MIAGNGGFAIYGIDGEDGSGEAVSNAGDVNGDGIDDLIVGAPANFFHTDRPGESYVIFGKANGSLVELSIINAGIGGFIINGIDYDDMAGISVSTAGDVNGDGV